jgi:hypothetical protein
MFGYCLRHIGHLSESRLFALNSWQSNRHSNPRNSNTKDRFR